MISVAFDMVILRKYVKGISSFNSFCVREVAFSVCSILTLSGQFATGLVFSGFKSESTNILTLT